jgi:hypothetical protein
VNLVDSSTRPLDGSTVENIHGLSDLRGRARRPQPIAPERIRARCSCSASPS